MLNVMIVGQKWLAEQLLTHCLNTQGIEVVAVSPPCDESRLATTARLNCIPVIKHGKTLNASDVPEDVDVILTAHAYCFVTAKARDKARLGAIGYHPSLLPAYKGKHAIAHAFNAGERVTGGSLYQLDDGWDTGRVISQASVLIEAGDTIQTLWRNKLAVLGLELFKDYLAGIK